MNCSIIDIYSYDGFIYFSFIASFAALTDDKLKMQPVLNRQNLLTYSNDFLNFDRAPET